MLNETGGLTVTRLIIQAHNELVLGVPENELAQAKEKFPGMIRHAEPKVPLEVGVGDRTNWDDAH